MIGIKDLYWLSGLIEGEGCFSLKDNHGIPAIRFSIKMTDKDVVYKAHNTLKLGYVYGPIITIHRKDCWDYIIHRQSDVAALMMTLYPLMGERRQKKIRELLAIWKSIPIKRKSTSQRTIDAAKLKARKKRMRDSLARSIRLDERDPRQ